MGKNSIFWTGILGVFLFLAAAVVGSWQAENYDPLSQYISETYAIDSSYGPALRFLGYVPSGILLSLFAFGSRKQFPRAALINQGFFGLAFFYGLATILVGLFPCDQGCNKQLIDPSNSQMIHSIVGMFTYIFVPISILAIGLGLRQKKVSAQLSKIALSCGVIGMIFSGFFLLNPVNDYAGLFQRIVEGSFLVWVTACAIFIRRNGRAAEEPPLEGWTSTDYKPRTESS